ncbi:ER membrane protein complex subunit 2-like isoform X2 [Eurosta solidaginis]|uniref:ER membrane protein complex subunit 2-like isoform X2 n=1 Tax=Eurosta solidaginis TaxID=178769 RepID=UPI003530721C
MENYREMNWRVVRDQFRNWREDNVRRSEEVVHLWEAILESHIHKTGNEHHLILEQVILAALDISRLDIAGKCIEILSIDFPQSTRVVKFEAMRLEALQMYDEATDLLDEIIAKDETNPAPRKRKIAILKEKGKNMDVIKELSEYLKMFMSDQEAWHELCRLYLMDGDFSKAIFCMEEVLLHNPHSHLICQRIAEIRYTMIVASFVGGAILFAICFPKFVNLLCWALCKAERHFRVLLQ